MLMFVLQSALLLAIAFALGAVAGCLLQRRFAAGQFAAIAGQPVRSAEVPVRREAEPLKAAEPPRPAAIEELPKPAETVAEKTEAAPAPTAEEKSAVAPAPAGVKDDLKRIRGIGKQNEKKLNDAGVTTYAQIAAWKPEDQKAWGEKLAFPGRIEREDWVGQARTLAASGETKLARRPKDGDVSSSS